jgi:hypothetical protein
MAGARRTRHAVVMVNVRGRADLNKRSKGSESVHAADRHEDP